MILLIFADGKFYPFSLTRSKTLHFLSAGMLRLPGTITTGIAPLSALDQLDPAVQ